MPPGLGYPIARPSPVNYKNRALTVPSDIEIAREAILKPIGDIDARLGIPPETITVG
jgi:hypothetical protein